MWRLQLFLASLDLYLVSVQLVKFWTGVWYLKEIDDFCCCMNSLENWNWGKMNKVRGSRRLLSNSKSFYECWQFRLESVETKYFVSLYSTLFLFLILVLYHSLSFFFILFLSSPSPLYLSHSSLRPFCFVQMSILPPMCWALIAVSHSKLALCMNT